MPVMTSPADPPRRAGWITVEHFERLILGTLGVIAKRRGEDGYRLHDLASVMCKYLAASSYPELDGTEMFENRRLTSTWARALARRTDAGWEKRIDYNPAHFLDGDEEGLAAFIETMLHEFAHVIANVRHGSNQRHNANWKAVCLELGIEPSARSAPHRGAKCPPRHAVGCRGCGVEYWITAYRARRLSRQRCVCCGCALHLLSGVPPTTDVHRVHYESRRGRICR